MGTTAQEHATNRRRSPTLLLAIIITLLTALLMTVTLCISGRWQPLQARISGQSAGGQSYQIGVNRHLSRYGLPLAAVEHTSDPLIFQIAPRDRAILSTDEAYQMWVREHTKDLERRGQWTELSEFHRYPGGGWKVNWLPMSADVAFWLLVSTGMVLGPVWIVRLLRRRRYRDHGLCITCGYDLRGSREMGRCPECGMAFPAEDLHSAL